MANMMLKPDKGLLEDLIAQAEGLNAADYEAESYEAVTAALAAAKDVAADENASQDEVNASAETLKGALAKLILADGTPVADSGNADKTAGSSSAGKTSFGSEFSCESCKDRRYGKCTSVRSSGSSSCACGRSSCSSEKERGKLNLL